jgi:2-keto-3-deoxy-L-rhamnonate aldolase RhmA
MNSLRERLASEAKFIVTFCIVPHGDVVELIGLAGFDGVILDMEHGPLSIDSLPGLIRAAHAASIFALVRVPDASPSQIGSALDAGADGIIVPQIGSAEAARSVAEASRFAPSGKRGANPWVRAAGFSGRPSWFAEANERVVVLVMIEGREGVEAAEEIIETPGLDGVFLGPVDLSHAVGVPGQIDHPDVVAKIREVVELARRHGKTTAVFAPTPQGARAWLSSGVKMAAVGVDTAHILAGFRDMVRQTKE